MSAIVPGNFTSPIDLGLPLSPVGEDIPSLREELLAAYNAIQILQIELTKVLDRLTAAGIP